MSSVIKDIQAFEKTRRTLAIIGPKIMAREDAGRPVSNHDTLEVQFRRLNAQKHRQVLGIWNKHGIHLRNPWGSYHTQKNVQAIFAKEAAVLRLRAMIRRKLPQLMKGMRDKGREKERFRALRNFYEHGGMPNLSGRATSPLMPVRRASPKPRVRSGLTPTANRA